MKRSKLMIAVALSCMLCASAVPTTQAQQKLELLLAEAQIAVLLAELSKDTQHPKVKRKQMFRLRRVLKTLWVSLEQKEKAFPEAQLKDAQHPKVSAKKRKENNSKRGHIALFFL